MRSLLFEIEWTRRKSEGSEEGIAASLFALLLSISAANAMILFYLLGQTHLLPARYRSVLRTKNKEIHGSLVVWYDSGRVLPAIPDL